MSRLDQELVERDLFKTRSKAAQAIKSGIVYCNEKNITKCGYEVNSLTKIEVRGEILRYVSRGGLKLEKAIQTWNLSLKNKIMIDIGSSTGGFSDCALQNDVRKIYAIDVGKDQFDLELSKNPKIILMEQTDFRTVSEGVLIDANFITIDVSFISVTKLVDKISSLTNIKEIICLIKPQFECGKEIADQYKGIIRNKQVHLDVIQKVITAFEKINFICEGLTYSPIQGGDGNIEYLGYFKKAEELYENEKIERTEVKRIEKIKIEEIINEGFEKTHK